MTDLEELIEVADRLCNRLEKAASDEKKFSLDLCLQFERQSWEMFKLCNEIKELREFYA